MIYRTVRDDNRRIRNVMPRHRTDHDLPAICRIGLSRDHNPRTAYTYKAGPDRIIAGDVREMRRPTFDLRGHDLQRSWGALLSRHGPNARDDVHSHRAPPFGIQLGNAWSIARVGSEVNHE